MNELDFSHEPDLGYYFYPSEIPDHPGHPRMDVILAAVPSGRHFDPLKVSYPIASQAGGIDEITVCHPWSQSRRYRVCAGRVKVTDRRGKVVEAFTFGGELQIVSRDGCTVCGLVSPASILPLYTSLDLPMCLTAEVEILLACQKAHWDPQHPHDFEEHLAAADPFQLYVGCLQALLDKGDDLHTGSGALDHQGEHFIRAEVHRLKEDGSWPRAARSVEQLFSAEVRTSAD